ncbi:MAG: hypothetical protein V5A52_05175 [Halovenus sp.]|uniref:DUF7263 family protein n=1 Tax=Halovenus amylolytica TaxID=2500550 RepID=UPI000FE3FAC3
MRAQTELPAIGIAFLLLTVVVILVVGTANTALTSADRPAIEQQEAAGLSDQLVSQRASITSRANVLDAEALPALTASDLHQEYGLSPGHDARVQLDGDAIAVAGDPDEGTTVDRLVVVEERVERTLQPAFTNNRSVTLPRRTPNATLEIDPQPGTVVRSVRADDRILLRNQSGLRGTFDVSLSRYETVQLSFETAGVLSTGDVRIVYYPAQTRKATLRVTVDA